MANMIKIAGMAVDADDPCQVKTALEAARTKVALGENVEEISIQSPTTRETVRFSPANRAALEAEIQRYDRLCRQKNGQCVRGRRWSFRY